MWTSEIVQSLDNPTIANKGVYRPKDGEKAGDKDQIDKADDWKHGEVTNSDVLVPLLNVSPFNEKDFGDLLRTRFHGQWPVTLVTIE
jgi:hypothetical protein